MSDIECPFCSQRFPAAELLRHSRECREEKNRRLKEEQQQEELEAEAALREPQQVLVSRPRPNIQIAEDDQDEPTRSEEAPRKEVSSPETVVRQQFPVAQAAASAAGQGATRGTEADAPAPGEDVGDRVACPICGRYFSADRIERHKAVCAREQGVSRKVFDAAQQRLQGDDPDAEKFVRRVEPKRTLKDIDKTPKVRATKLNWDANEPVEQFGQGAAKNFRAEYDDGQQPAPVEPPGAQPAVQPAEQKIGGDRILRSPVAKDVKTEDKEPARRHHRHRHTSSSKKSKLQELEQLQKMYQTMSAAAYAPQEPFTPVEPVATSYEMQPYAPEFSYGPPPPQYAQQQPCRFCVYCGTKYMEQAEFCGVCGAKRIAYI